MGGCRGDEVDVLREAQDGGWSYIDRWVDHGADNLTLPLLGLFASHDFSYEIDRRHRNTSLPSLETLTRAALTLLSEATRTSDKGFFLLIEGSRIDHAGHANDPAAQVHEVAAYDRAVRAARAFIDGADADDPSIPTVLVATSDHETGGLAVARQLTPVYPRYEWFPAVLANASHSVRRTAHEYHAFLRALRVSPSSSSHTLTSPERTTTEAGPDEKDQQNGPTETEKQSHRKTESFLRTLLSSSLGITAPTDAELSALLSSPLHADSLLADMLSRRAQTGWSTHGHSAADVNVYAHGAGARTLRGVVENTDIGAWLARWLRVVDEMAEVQALLSAAAAKGEGEEHEEGEWMGSPASLGTVSEEEEEGGGDGRAHGYGQSDEFFSEQQEEWWSPGA